MERLKEGTKSTDAISTVFIIPHQLDDLTAQGGGAGQGADRKTKRFVTGDHLWLLPAFHNFWGSEASSPPSPPRLTAPTPFPPSLHHSPPPTSLSGRCIHYTALNPSYK